LNPSIFLVFLLTITLLKPLCDFDDDDDNNNENNEYDEEEDKKTTIKMTMMTVL